MPGDANNNTPLKAWARALEKVSTISPTSSVTLPALIDDLADQFDMAPALLDDGVSLSYRALRGRCNQYARWALRKGLAAGDVICLLMHNCSDYMAIWLGMTRIGGIVSLLNTNIAGDHLAHSIRIAAPKYIIVGDDLVDAVLAVLPKLPAGVQIWVHGQSNHHFPRIDYEIQEEAGDRIHFSECQSPSIIDQALYIYTSGTTGLPKAANVSHFRLMQWCHWFAGMIDTCPSDRMYNCLPMYHSIGGVVATGAVLVNGGSVVIRKKFSASHFWNEVVQWDCTLFQYIGELCRYLVNTPLNQWERQHRIRLCCGSGLRPSIWQEFEWRFRIPKILEFYAATEANFSLYNCEGKLGAIGRIPPFLAHRFPVALLKLDIETGEPVRNENGFCTACGTNEVGEAISKILGDGSHPASRFEGYTDREASEAKVLRDVFVNGDAWFRSGDLLRKDEQGFFYFVDRIGDTFRWKGENVSTTEIADTISTCPGVAEAIVYGVIVPGTEGRAGMAALVVTQDFDVTIFRKHLAERLPEYARPLFLRVRRALETTATFKPKKQELLQEGFDPARTADPIYFNDAVRGAFVKLDGLLYERIRSGSGEVRL